MGRKFWLSEADKSNTLPDLKRAGGLVRHILMDHDIIYVDGGAYFC